MDFFSVVDTHQQNIHPSHKVAESFFDFGQKKYSIKKLDLKSKQCDVIKNDSKKTSFFKTVLKIILIATVIFPLVILAIKAHFRHSYKFNIIDPKTDNTNPNSDAKPDISKIKNDKKDDKTTKNDEENKKNSSLTANIATSLKTNSLIKTPINKTKPDITEPKSDSKDEKPILRRRPRQRQFESIETKIGKEQRKLRLERRKTRKLLKKECTNIDDILKHVENSNLKKRNTLRIKGNLKVTINKTPVILLQGSDNETYAIIGDTEKNVLGNGKLKSVLIGFQVNKKPKRVALAFVRKETHTKELFNEGLQVQNLEKNGIPCIGEVLAFCKLQGNKEFPACIIQKLYKGGSLEKAKETLTIKKKTSIIKKLTDMIAELRDKELVYSDWHLPNILLDKKNNPYITDLDTIKSVSKYGPNAKQEELRFDIIMFCALIQKLFEDKNYELPNGMETLIQNLKDSQDLKAFKKALSKIKH